MIHRSTFEKQRQAQIDRILEDFKIPSQYDHYGIWTIVSKKMMISNCDVYLMEPAQ